MQCEYDAIMKNGTWTLCDLALCKKAICTKWVYKLKCNPNGSVECYKSRLVAKGYAQDKGIYFEEIFDSTCYMNTICSICALVAHYG